MKETILGINVSWLLVLAVVVLIIVGGTGFAVWYNYHLAVPLENSERHVATCSMQYLTTQQSKIENNLNAISNTETEIGAPGYEGMTAQLKAQERQDAREIYNSLDASDCSRSQIIQNTPELSDFFVKFPNR